jgi:hypothetical protein
MKIKVMIGMMMIMGTVYGQVNSSLSQEEQLLVLQHRQAKENPIEQVQNVSAFSTNFAEACKSFLSVFDEGTTITIERLNQFMETPAGKFTVVIIAWKTMGNDFVKILGGSIETIVGLFLLIPYAFFIKFLFRVFIVGKNVMVLKEGKIKKYVWKEPFATQVSNEAYASWSFVSIVLAAIFLICLLVLIF